MGWIVAQLNIHGIKGIPHQVSDFELAQERSPRSIAIYDPGAGGNSGYADAVEYLFSEGDSPAEERGIEPKLSMTLVNAESGESVLVTRLVNPEQANDMSPELRPIVRAAPAYRVLRQRDLRNFVGDMAPDEPRDQDAAELFRWFGLTRLAQVLKHLEATSRELAGRDLSWEIVGRMQDIARHTDNSVTQYDERAVLDWCEAETERHLGKRLAIDSVEGMKKAIRTLKRLQGRIIVASSATDGSYQAKLALKKLATGLISPTRPEHSRRGGQLPICHAALTDAVAAERHTESLLTRAKNSVFQEVWSAAQGVLESQITGECPVCRTPWQKTRAGSQEAALITITRSRDDLAELAAARNEQQQTTRRLKKAIRNIEKRLTRVSTEAKKLSLSKIETQATELVKAARALVAPDRFPSQMQDECEAFLARCHQFVAQRLHSALQGLPPMMAPVTTTQVEAAIESFHALWDALIRLRELHREQDEYQKVKHSFDAMAEVIRERTAALVNDVVVALEDKVQSIYQTIHPADTVPNIHIVPDTESRTLSMRLTPPAGDLSDFQMNTLGLALFISSVGLFNRQFPFLFLDDVFTPYDADHRERIVDLVAERLDGFQVFLTTHDGRLYSMLKDRLHDKGWLFERIEEG